MNEIIDNMKVETLVDIIGADFYTGVPDSQLIALCNYLMNTYGINPQHHVIAANEGNCTALAAGYYLATNKVPVVYMQNSGEGNIINPIASLLNEQVYAIPIIFVIGWRGEPGIHDEPQHIYQGKITIKLLEDMNIESFIISKSTTCEEVRRVMDKFRQILATGNDVAFIISKDAISYDGEIEYKNSNTMVREEVIQHLVKIADEDPVISTTGKVSRELFEIRVANGQDHKYDFLTVGSMGHSSSIALGVAINKPNTKVWCIDGDGSVLMHMGAMAILGANAPPNIIHIIINNGAHDTVGGIPTVANKIDLVGVAKACGYPNAISVNSLEQLDAELKVAKEKKQLTLIEAKCATGARDTLGRPTTTTLENKMDFMEYLKNLK